MAEAISVYATAVMMKIEMDFLKNLILHFHQ
jgi:hypothetical protein